MELTELVEDKGSPTAVSPLRNAASRRPLPNHHAIHAQRSASLSELGRHENARWPIYCSASSCFQAAHFAVPKADMVDLSVAQSSPEKQRSLVTIKNQILF